MSIFSDRLRIVPEFRSDERDGILETLFGRLERRLSQWKPEQVELELSVKERDSASQRTVLECWIAGVPRMVATSTERDIDKAVIEVRDDLFRQLNRYVTRREDSRRG
jgi:ribosome-associated translation inhibitor RaiA